MSDPDPNAVSIKVPSNDPKKKTPDDKDKDNAEGSSKLPNGKDKDKDALPEGEDELVRVKRAIIYQQLI